MKTLALPNGHAIVLNDMLAETGSWDDINRNVIRTDESGRVVWRIETDASPEERQPYTNVYYDDDGLLKAYNWSGIEYRLDAETGAISDGVLIK